MLTIDMNTNNQDGTTLNVAIQGRIDSTSVDDFNNEVFSAIDNANALVINMEECKYLSSAGLRSLLNLHQEFMGKGGMTLTNVNDYIMEIFEFTGFDSIFNIQ